jgi:hypothetical protein
VASNVLRRRHLRSTVSHEGLARTVTQGAADALPWASLLPPFRRPVVTNTACGQSPDLCVQRDKNLPQEAEALSRLHRAKGAPVRGDEKFPATYWKSFTQNGIF